MVAFYQYTNYSYVSLATKSPGRWLGLGAYLWSR